MYIINQAKVKRYISLLLNNSIDTEGCYLQVVVFKSPKVLSGILRLLFKIKKVEEE